MSRVLFYFFAFALLFLTFAKPSIASENFDTSYKVTYTISENENTRVTLDIGLTNKTTDYYAASYGVQTGFEDISNIRVTDGSGGLNYKTEKNDKGTEISFDFNEKTVGINNTQRFSISFDTKEITKNFGTVWEVNIPGIAEQADYTSFNVEVRAPESIGFPSIIKPSVGTYDQDSNSLKFSKSDLGNGGISIAYGESQAYKFDLKYHIQNRNVFPQTTEIALPADNNYQKIAIDDINPKPLDVIIDEDGNWLARYKLLPSQKLNILVKGHAKISHVPTDRSMPLADKDKYLRADKYWEVNDPEIQKIAKDLKTPKEVYDYVVKNLKYDTKRIKEVQERAGARGVLLDKASAVCLEFTDLFVTLSRAAGIPARALEGYANTSNSADRPLSLVEDVLHAWPEYYDESKKTWVMVDPTWGNTTKGIDYFNVLDFDHLTFVTKGIESDYPVPAGGYKTSKEKEMKDVNVATVKDFPTDKPSVTFITEFPERFYGGFPMRGNIIVYNNSKFLVNKNSFTVTVEGLTPQSQTLTFDKIPPYGREVIPIKYQSVGLLTNSTYIVKISLGTDEIQKEIIVVPFYKNLTFVFAGGGLFVGTFLLILSFFIYRSRRLHFPQ